jgi:transcription termination/antitermination protein NusA
VVRVSVDEDTKTATVVVPERQLSLAIGKEGQNARLAAKLTGWRIDIKSEAAMRAAAERAREATEDEAAPALAEAGAQAPGEVRAEG